MCFDWFIILNGKMSLEYKKTKAKLDPGSISTNKLNSQKIESFVKNDPGT